MNLLPADLEANVFKPKWTDPERIAVANYMLTSRLNASLTMSMAPAVVSAGEAAVRVAPWLAEHPLIRMCPLVRKAVELAVNAGRQEITQSDIDAMRSMDVA